MTSKTEKPIAPDDLDDQIVDEEASAELSGEDNEEPEADKERPLIVPKPTKKYAATKEELANAAKLPRRLTPNLPQMVGLIQCVPGIRGTWVAFTPDGISRAEYMGITLVNVNDETIKLVTNSHVFKPTPEGYLKRGDTLVGIIAEVDYHKFLEETVKAWRARVRAVDGKVTVSKSHAAAATREVPV